MGPRTRICPGCKHDFFDADGKPWADRETPAPAHRASDILPEPPPPTPPSTSLPPETPMPETLTPETLAPEGVDPKTPMPTDPNADPRGKLCIDHPEYQAEKPPRIACEGCWRAYLKEKFGERVRPLDPAHIVMVNDEREVTKFVADLIAARTKSRHGGGCYSAFLHGKEIVLQVDVHLNWILE